MDNRARYISTAITFVLIVCIISLVAYSGNYKNDTPAGISPMQRFGMVTGLKAGKLAYYKKLHAAVWPAVLKQIKASNIHNYSIYLQKINGQYFLFSYFEYTGNDFDKDMQKMAADPITRRWWKATEPTQNPLPEAAEKHKIWANMQEVFHTP